MGGFGDQGMILPNLRGTEGDGKSIVVSVGLLPLTRDVVMTGGRTPGSEGKIYQLDRFMLDIFLFNQSEGTRSFEISAPYRRRMRKKDKGAGVGEHPSGVGSRKAGTSPGILPLDNRVRIG
jgi:hypothetical protein